MRSSLTLLMSIILTANLGAAFDFKAEIKKYNAQYPDNSPFFASHPIAKLPKNLHWKNGQDQPEIGSSDAHKGGNLRTGVTYHPRELYPFGPEANNTFRSYLYDNIELGLVGLHPITNKPIPAIASKWAVSKDQKTVYYHIDPKATYSDGTPITPTDFQRRVILVTSDHSQSPFYKRYIKNSFSSFYTYGKNIIAITLKEPGVYPEYFTSSSPSHPTFYKDFDPNYTTDYKFKKPPSTGPYTVNQDLTNRNQLTLTRNKNWWAKDRKFYKNRYNADTLTYIHTPDPIEALMTNKIDHAQGDLPIEHPKEITTTQFPTNYPPAPRGLYLNTAAPLLNDKNIRLGIQHSCNFTPFIIASPKNLIRLPSFTQGFGDFTHPSIKARAYNPSKAQNYFHKAGFKQKNEEGILIDEKGNKLSFEISAFDVPIYKDLIASLVEHARKAGLELVPNFMETSVAFKHQMEKRHQIALAAWGMVPPLPRYKQFFHSSTSKNDDGTPKVYTNNLNSYSTPDLDKMIEKYHTSTDLKQKIKLAHNIQNHIHNAAIFVPGFYSPTTTILYKNHLQFPKQLTDPNNAPQQYSPLDGHTWWLDKPIKLETPSNK